MHLMALHQDASNNPEGIASSNRSFGGVLPWGQMSLWGATVITNLLSAIPWIGNDFVLLIWGWL